MLIACRLRGLVSFVVGGTIHLIAGLQMQAAVFSVAPGSVTAEYQGELSFGIKRINVGETVVIEKYLDLNQNGSVDDEEMMTQSFRITDGAVVSIGEVRNTNVPGDEDGLVNGEIRSELSFVGQSEANFTVGQYLYKATSPSDAFLPVFATFTVTKPPHPQSVNGQVTSEGAPVPYAVVVLDDGRRPVALSMTDTNGRFTLVSSPGIYKLLVLKSGYLFDFAAASTVTVGADETLTRNLSLSRAEHVISGRLMDEATDEGIAGVQVFTQSTSGQATLEFTDGNGNFHISVSSEEEWAIIASENDASLKGYVSLEEEMVAVNTSGGSLSGVSIRWPKASALIHGRLVDDQDNGLAHIGIEAELDEEYRVVGNHRRKW